LKRRIWFLSVLVIFVCIWNLANVVAQAKIGYVDSERILTSYPAAIDARKKLEVENEKWDRELQEMNQEFQTMQDQLDQQSLLLSEAKKKEKMQELQAMVLKIQQFQDQKWGEGGEYFKNQEKLMQPVIDQINEAIHKVGEEEGYDIIFDSVAGNILHAKDKYNITDQVLNELGKGSSSEK
jgi:outer membrane protein